MSCNRTGSDIVREFWGTTVEIELYIPHSTVQDLDALAQIGAGAAGLYGALVEAGVISAGALSGPLAVAVGSILVVYLGWIMYADNGCGVKVSGWITPVGFSGVTVSSQ
ncbi:MAG: hypothetical protein ABEJ42_02545 [Halobacteriaceae archaeon]